MSVARIGIDARTASNVLGGIRTYSRGLISGLESIDSPHEFVVFRSKVRPRPIEASRFRQVELHTPNHHRLEPVSLSVELARRRLTILHSLDFIPPLRGARHHVITVHDLAFLRYPEFLTPGARGYYNSQIKRAVRQAAHILAVSDATRNDLTELLGVEDARISVQVEGVDDVFHPLQPELFADTRQRLGLPESYFLFVGTLEPRKNIPGLLEGYRLLREQVADAPSLVLVGRRGWLFDDDAIERPPSGVVWYGEMAYQDLPAAYSLATALVMPSFYEGFGLPALEAMASGTVPIVSATSSFAEVVGEVGVQVDPHDPQAIAAALYRAATDSAWREDQERKGLARSSLFTWERSAQTALDVYNALL